MYFGPSWRAHEINQLAQQQEVDLHYKVVPIPQLLQTNVTWATYWVEAVSANSPVKNEAWQFLKYLSRVDTMQRLYEQQMAVTGRDFGEIPSRVDLGEQFKNHPIIGAYILQAPAAQSWYLVDATTDQQGLNARVSKYYQDAVNRASRGEAPVEALRPVVEGLPPVLAEYGL
jgi:ABC-type glycerol-3-phosphate transport system substrate-binding protein